MNDEQLVGAIQSLDERGKDGLPALRELLRVEGGFSRLVPILKKGVEKAKRDTARAEAPDSFEAFWALCPAKKDKDAARRAYTRALKRVAPEVLDSAMRAYAVEMRGSEFIKNPATWLNAGSWMNEALPLAGLSPVAQLATLEDWIRRLEMFTGLASDTPKGTWSPKWDAVPGRAPPAAVTEFNRRYPAQKIAEAM